MGLGEYDSALTWIDNILDHVNETGSHSFTAELFGIKGPTLQALGKSDAIVEENLTQTLELSRKQSAKTFEFRAASDLARLQQKQGTSQDGYDLLKSLYNWFTEGFDSVDLKEASLLLTDLNTGNLNAKSK